MKNIVVFLQNRDFFGAQIVHIPLLKFLRKKYIGCKIYIVSKHKVSNLLINLSIADEIIYDKNKLSTFYSYIKINPNITINLRKNSSFINFYVSLFNFKKKFGFKTFLTNLFFSKSYKHNNKIYRSINYLNIIDINLFDYSIKKDINKRISIIPGAGDDFKIWDIKNYIEVAKYLKDKYNNYEICFIIGEKEKDFLNQIDKNEFKVYFNLEINKLFNIIETSELTIANDCGPSHIAQISNNKYLILYSNKDNDAKGVIKEWFNPTKNGLYIIGENNKDINSINKKEVIDKSIELLQRR